MLWRKIKCRCWDSAHGPSSELAGLNVLPAPKVRKDGFIPALWEWVCAYFATANQEAACRRKLFL